MKRLFIVLELILLICMIALVYIKADVRVVIEAGVLYLAMVIKSTMESKE